MTLKHLSAIVAGITIATLVAPLPLLTPKAEAIAAFEINPIVISGITAIAGSTAAIAGSTVAETTQTLLEWGQSFILAELKKRVLDLMVDQIVAWIQGGGDPKFITDWRGFLEDIGQAVVGDMAQFLGLGFLCSPFNLQVQLTMFAPPKFSTQVTCTLDQIVGNIENFFDDFRNGSWIAYQEMWRPQNNFYGATLLAWNAKEQEIAARTEAARNEAIAGQGFLSTKDAQGRITTPGMVIGATLAKAVGSDIDYIINADQLAAYISAIADALINRLVKAGVEGIKGLSTPKAPSGGAVAGPPGGGGPCVGLSGSALSSCLNYTQTYGNSFDSAQNNMLAQVDLSLQPRLEAKNLIQESIDLENNLIASLEKLLTCRQSSTNPTINALAGAVSDEISAEENILLGLQSELAANQTIIDSLEINKQQIQSVSSGNWASLTVVFNNISQALNTQASIDFKANAVAERDTIKQKVDARLLTAQQDLIQCQSPLITP